MSHNRGLRAKVYNIIHDLLGRRVLHSLANAVVAVPLGKDAVGVRALGVEFTDGVGFQAVLFPVLFNQRHVLVYVVFGVEG